MPFGFEVRQSEQDKFDICDPGEPIEVIAISYKNGMVKPLSIVVDDVEYKVERVLDYVNCRELKQRMIGFRYRCLVGGRVVVLVYDGERWWLVGK